MVPHRRDHARLRARGFRGALPPGLAKTAQKHCAQAIFGSIPNIWFLEPPESRFEAFLVPSPTLLPEWVKNMARKLFLSLDRISGFGTSRKPF